jgi:hypothetical protein
MGTGTFVRKVSQLTSQSMRLASTGTLMTPISVLYMAFPWGDRCNPKK